MKKEKKKAKKEVEELKAKGVRQLMKHKQLVMKNFQMLTKIKTEMVNLLGHVNTV